MPIPNTLDTADQTPSHPRYDAYKDSGVEWLGEIPEHWEQIKLKYISHIDSSGVWGDDPDAADGQTPGEVIPVARVSDIGWNGEVVHEEMPPRYLGTDDVARYSCSPGDILVVKASGSANNIITGRSALVKKQRQFAFGNFLLRIRAGNSVANKFLFYFISSSWVQQGIERMVATTTYPNLNVGEYSSFAVPVPPLPEQRAIAAYLDRETERIDTLVAKKERLIELLEEKRTALISHAVTKGLDDDAEMTDSGVEWIGAIPAGWETTTIKWISEITYGLSQPPAELENGIPFLRATNISRGQILEAGMKYVDPEDVPEQREALLESGDLLVVRSGAYTGDSAIVSNKYDGSVAGYDMIVRVREGFSSKYLAYCFLREAFGNQVIMHSSRAAQPHLNAEELGSFSVPVPPISKQRAIAEYLDQETEQIDTLIEKVRDGIARLKEYRTALISAAVTGRIDVRGMA